MNKRKLCVVTGCRAEYGLLYWVMKGIADDPTLELQVIATGMHLAPEFGLTYKAIEADGFAIDAKVEMLLSSDTVTGISKSLGLGLIGFADAFERLQPDAVVLLGDRFEIMAAAQAGFIAGIAIAHISGGEVTTGAIDDVIRHCISKMSRYHFVAAEAYRQRVIQLGEQPESVFNVGDPGLDNIARLPLMSRQQLAEAIEFDTHRPYFLATFHPVTTGGVEATESLQALLSVLDQYPSYGVILTKANADTGGRELNHLIDSYAAERPGRVLAVTSLGQLRYLSAMKHCAAVIGNSSSGIVEAPAMRVPTVNIGSRQDGRLKADSILDCADTADAISQAIAKVLSTEFSQRVSRTLSLYGDCDASDLICAKLKEVVLDRKHAKVFHDLPG
jgi:UDP-hydrolysing UDP-N-acetyl-D-glucosamine 2-epimerase